jgi:hypothetical protein
MSYLSLSGGKVETTVVRCVPNNCVICRAIFERSMYRFTTQLAWDSRYNSLVATHQALTAGDDACVSAL